MIGSESRPIRKWFEARAKAPRVKAQKRSARNPHVHTSGGADSVFRHVRATLRVSIFLLLQLSSCVVLVLVRVFLVSAVLHLSWRRPIARRKWTGLTSDGSTCQDVRLLGVGWICVSGHWDTRRVVHRRKGERTIRDRR